MQEIIERSLTAEQRMMRDAIRSFVDREVTPFIRTHWKKEWDMVPENRPSLELLQGAHNIGVRALGIPEEFGGTPVDPATEVQTFAMVAEEISRGDSGLADKLVQIWKVSKLLQNIAPRHLQEKWFPRIVEDPSFLLAHALTEPRGASDRWLPYDVPEAMMHTRAVKQGGKWVINGRKHFITNGYDAKLYVVYATTTPGTGIAKGTSSFLVPRDTPGLTVMRCNETLGGRFMNNGEIVFEDCAVPEDHCLVQDVAMTRAGVYFRPGKIIVAAKNLGVGMAAFEKTADYVQNYVQGGRILIKHQAVAVRVGEMITKLNAVRALLNEAIRAVNMQGHDAEGLCNMAKLFASEEIFRVCMHAVELHGGNGIMLDFGVEKFMRDASLFLHRDATVDISKFKIVKHQFPHTAGKYAGPEN
ncbi:MAG TPA: acyl-CoA dehydrogenase family protein [Burkholderiales bacterium]|nr:acyl-CoA dehydrogenase family protein [Burkholderiales bacterium]